MINKIFIFVACGCALLAGCVNNGEENMPDAEIKYQVVRALTVLSADATRTTEYPKTIPFASYAYYLPAGKTWSADSGVAQLYINGAAVSYDAVKDIWHAATTYYWPKTGSLTFFAYSPATIPAVCDRTGVSLTGWDVEANQTADFLVADVAVDKSATVGNYVTNGVPTLFRHKLAQVAFKFKLDEEYANVSITVKSVSMSNIYTVGDYSSLTSEWANWTGEKTINIFSGSLTLTPVEQMAGNIHLVLPQAFRLRDNSKFTIIYDITESGVTSTKTRTIAIKDISTFWEKNKNITYTMVFAYGTADIDFDAAVTDWVWVQ